MADQSTNLQSSRRPLFLTGRHIGHGIMLALILGLFANNVLLIMVNPRK